jgi:hypothetical protein
MLHNMRTIGPLLRSLPLRVAVNSGMSAATAVVLGALLCGCPSSTEDSMVPVSTPNTNGQDDGKSPAHTCDPSEDPLPFADQVKQQNNAATQEQAVQHLLQVFEDTMNRAGNDRSDETVRSLLDKVVPPLVQVYLEASNTTDGWSRSGSHR